jgi:thioredoxin 2
MVAPQFEKAATLRPRYRFARVDADAAPRLAARFGIRSILTLAMLRDGKPVAMQAGVMSAEQLVQALDRLDAGVLPASAKAAA